jgi:hypothetical protein
MNLFWFACGAMVVAGFLFIAVQSATKPQPHRAALTRQQPLEAKPHEVGGDKLAIDQSIATYTGWLALFTLILAASTIGLWITAIVTSRKQTADMQSTINLARDEFLSTHRPKIRVKHVVLNSGIWEGERISVKVVLVNSGATDAIISEWGIKFIIEEKGRMLPALPTIERLQAPGIAGGVLPSGISLDIPDVSDRTILNDSQNVAIRRGNSQLYCVGYIHYADGARRIRTTAFCRVLTFPEFPTSHQDTGRFRVFDDSDYEYED